MHFVLVEFPHDQDTSVLTQFLISRVLRFQKAASFKALAPFAKQCVKREKRQIWEQQQQENKKRKKGKKKKADVTVSEAPQVIPNEESLPTEDGQEKEIKKELTLVYCGERTTFVFNDAGMPIRVYDLVTEHGGNEGEGGEEPPLTEIVVNEEAEKELSGGEEICEKGRPIGCRNEPPKSKGREKIVGKCASVAEYEQPIDAIFKKWMKEEPEDESPVEATTPLVLASEDQLAGTKEARLKGQMEREEAPVVEESEAVEEESDYVDQPIETIVNEEPEEVIDSPPVAEVAVSSEEPPKNEMKKTQLTSQESTEAPVIQEEEVEADEEESEGEPGSKRRKLALGYSEDSNANDSIFNQNQDSKKKKRSFLAFPIKNKRKESAAGRKKKEEREMDEEEDRMGGYLGGFDGDSDQEEHAVKDTVAKAKNKPLRDNRALNEEEEQEDVDVTMDDDDSEKEDQEERDCPVDGCSEKCPSEESLRKHMRIHPKPVLCKTCQKAFKKNEDLRRHYRVHSGARPFKCTYCKRKFSRPYHLNTHIRLHTRETPYGCDKCDKKFNNPGSLDYHRRKHDEETMFPCTTCDYRSASTSDLKRHMRKHTGVKPFKCTDCDRCFSRKDYLERHKASVHMGKKPFKCSDCDHSFSAKQNLEEHKAGIHTGVKKYACKECEYKTAYRTGLSVHMKKVHQK